MAISKVRPKKWVWTPNPGILLPMPRRFFPLWEGTGTTIADAVTGIASAAFNAGITWAGDSYGPGGLDFDGTHTVTLPYIDASGDCTITFGFSIPADVNQGILSLVGSPPQYDLCAVNYYNGILYIGVSTAGSGSAFELSSPTFGSWYDFIVVKTYSVNVGLGVAAYYSKDGGAWSTLSPIVTAFGNASTVTMSLGSGAVGLSVAQSGTKIGYLGVYDGQIAPGAKLTALQADPFIDMRGRAAQICIAEVQMATGGDLDPTANNQCFIRSVANSNASDPLDSSPGEMLLGSVRAYGGNQVLVTSDVLLDSYLANKARLFTSADKGTTWAEVLFSGNALLDNLTANQVPSLHVTCSDGTTHNITIQLTRGGVRVTCTDSTDTTVLPSSNTYFAYGTKSVYDVAAAITAIANGKWSATAYANAASSTFATATNGAWVGNLVPVTAAAVATSGAGGTDFNSYFSIGNAVMGINPANGQVLAIATRAIDNNTAYLVGRFGASPYDNASWGNEFIIAGGPNVTLTGATTPASAGDYTTAGAYNGYPYFHNAATGTYLAVGYSGAIGANATHWKVLDGPPASSISTDSRFTGPSAASGPTGAYTTDFNATGSSTATSTGDQIYWGDAIKVNCLADGRWIIGVEKFIAGTGTLSGVLVSTLGATQTQLMNGAISSSAATPYWVFSPIGTYSSFGVENCPVQLANGKLLVAGRTSTYAVLSLGTVNADSTVTFVDPTYAANAIPYCTCDGGVNSSGGNTNRRPLIWSGGAPVDLLAMNALATTVVYVTNCVAPYSSSVKQTNNYNRLYTSIQQVQQTDLVGNHSIMVRPSPFGTVLAGYGEYAGLSLDGNTLIGSVGTKFNGSPLYLRGPALAAAAGGGGGILYVE